MRANEQRVASNDTPIDDFVMLLDDLAELPGRGPIQKPRGGDGLQRLRHSAKRAPRATTPISRARAGLAGVLAILLAGGLGFTIWTGPHGCLDCDDALTVAPSAQASNDADTASRFQYMANFRESLKLRPSDWTLDLDEASKTADARGETLPSKPEVAAAQTDTSFGPSPMTTSATGRLYNPQALMQSVASRHRPQLPAVAQEVLDAKPKPVRLTAANEISEEITPPPSVLAIERSSLNDASSIDIPIRKPNASERTGRQVQAQRPRRTARVRNKLKATQGNSVPGWASKMFDGNWQGSAFSYQQ